MMTTTTVLMTGHDGSEHDEQDELADDNRTD